MAARLAFVSVVVPVYNERESVRPLCEELLGVLRGMGRRFRQSEGFPDHDTPYGPSALTEASTEAPAKAGEAVG